MEGLSPRGPAGTVPGGAEQGHAEFSVFEVRAVDAVVDHREGLFFARDRLPVLGEGVLPAASRAELFAAEHGHAVVLAVLKDRRDRQFEPLFVLRPEDPDLDVESSGDLVDDVAHEHPGMAVLHVRLDDRLDFPFLHRADGRDRLTLDARKIGGFAGGHEGEAALGIAQIEVRMPVPAGDGVLKDLGGKGSSF